MILLKAQKEAEALTLINEILQQNKDLLTYRYVDKLGPGIKVMLVPNNNPFLLPIPDMGSRGGYTNCYPNTYAISDSDAYPHSYGNAVVG